MGTMGSFVSKDTIQHAEITRFLLLFFKDSKVALGFATVGALFIFYKEFEGKRRRNKLKLQDHKINELNYKELYEKECTVRRNAIADWYELQDRLELVEEKFVGEVRSLQKINRKLVNKSSRRETNRKASEREVSQLLRTIERQKDEIWELKQTVKKLERNYVYLTVENDGVRSDFRKFLEAPVTVRRGNSIED